jgi:hypothetical protein
MSGEGAISGTGALPDKGEAVENIAWWANMRDWHVARGEQIAARACQEDVNFLERELADVRNG